VTATATAPRVTESGRTVTTEANKPGPTRRWLRQQRRARDDDRGENAYLVLMTILIGGALLAGSWRSIAEIFASDLSGPAPHAAVLAASLLGYAFAVSGAARFGPVFSAPPRLAWWLTSPVSRRSLLWPTATVVLAVAAAVGGVHGSLVAMVLGQTRREAVATLVVAGAVAGLLTGALAVIAQTRTARSAIVLNPIAALLGLAAVVLTVPGLSLPPSVPAWIGPWAWPLAASGGGAWWWLALATAGAALLCTVAVGRLSRLTLTSLAAGGSFASMASAGIALSDPGIASRAIEEQRWTTRRLRRTGLPRRTGAAAVLAHDVVTVRRAPERLLIAAAAGLMPALFSWIAGPGLLLAAVWLVSSLAAAGTVTLNARRDRDLPELRRLLGLPSWKMLAARSVLPTLVGCVWGAASALLLAGRLASSTAGSTAGTGDAVPPGGGWQSWLLLGVAAGPALAAGALRAARRGPVQHDMPAAVTPMGLMSPAPFHWLLTGWDLGALFCLPMLIALVVGDPQSMLVPQAIVSAIGLAVFIAAAGRSADRV
jgi:Family of unknown function (DUF6297)